MSDLIDRQAAIDAILHITNCKSVRELFEYNQEHHLTEMWSGGVNDAIDAVIGVESAIDNNVGTKLSTNLASLGTNCISRQAAIDGKICIQRSNGVEIYDDYAVPVEYLEQLPPAQLGTNLAEVGTDCISRQAAISAICNACGKIDCDKMDKCEKLQLPLANCSEFPNNSDAISRQAAIDDIWTVSPLARLDHKWIDRWLRQLPSAQPKIIRCRECKFASGDSRICMKFDHSPIGELDFCSFAERREVTT